MRNLILLTLVVAATVAVPVAYADQPVFVPLGFGSFVDTDTCGFPVTVDVFANGRSAPGEVLKAFPSGKVIISGPLVASYSANGKTITLSIAGPTIITPLADGSVSIAGNGHSVVLLQTATGMTIAEVAGVVAYSPTNGPATLLRGTVQLDICAALAA